MSPSSPAIARTTGTASSNHDFSLFWPSVDLVHSSNRLATRSMAFHRVSPAELDAWKMFRMPRPRWPRMSSRS